MISDQRPVVSPLCTTEQSPPWPCDQRSPPPERPSPQMLNTSLAAATAVLACLIFSHGWRWPPARGFHVLSPSPASGLTSRARSVHMRSHWVKSTSTCWAYTWASSCRTSTTQARACCLTGLSRARVSRRRRRDLDRHELIFFKHQPPPHLCVVETEDLCARGARRIAVHLRDERAAATPYSPRDAHAIARSAERFIFASAWLLRCALLCAKALLRDRPRAANSERSPIDRPRDRPCVLSLISRSCSRSNTRANSRSFCAAPAQTHPTKYRMLCRP